MRVIKGSWFFPSNSNVKVTGTLRCSNEEGNVLEIEASFSGEEFNFNEKVYESDIILGENSMGEEVTLHECFQTNSEWKIGSNVYTAKWRANRAFIGCHAQSNEDLRFTELILHAHPIFMWFKPAAIRLNEINSTEKKFIFTAKTPEDIFIPLNDTLKATFIFGTSFSNPSPASESIDLLHSVRLSIKAEYGTDLHYKNLLDAVKRFSGWFAVSTGYPLEILKLSFYHESELIDYVHNDGSNSLAEIELYSKVKKIDRRPSSPHDFIFDYSQIEKFMPDILKKWFLLYDKIDVILDILVYNMEKSSVFNEFIFKDIVQALEAFHRKFIRNERMPKSEYKAFKKNILAQIAVESDRKFVEERLNYGNEPSLRERLNDLIDRCDLDAVKGAINDKKDFVDHIIENRNYHTHLDKTGKEKVLQTRGLYGLSERALLLLYATIMNEIVDDRNFMNKVLTSYPRWRYRTD